MGRPESKVTLLKECPVCYKQFETKLEQRIFCSRVCSNQSRSFEKEKRECPICHNLFEVTPVRTHYCSIQCRGVGRRVPDELKKQYIPKPVTIKQCRICGVDIPSKRGNRKHCDKCRDIYSVQQRQLYQKTEKYKIMHNELSKERQANNKLKVKAQSLAKSNFHLVKILYECPCEDSNKHNHHFDYSRPYEVIKLCGHCHMKEHKRLRSLSAIAERDSFTPADQSIAQNS